MLLMLVLSCLQACGVGIMKVEGPQLPLIKNPFPIDRDVYFEVCVPPKLRNTGWNNVMNKKIAAVLQRDFTIQPHPEVPAIDKPYFHFLFISETDNLYIASMLISFITFGVIPGYGVDQTEIDIQFATRDADGEMIQGRYKYEYRDRYFLWLPLIFYPDIVMGINGGYTNKNKENLGLELVLNRFILDASERMRQQPKDDKTVDAFQVLKCPAQ
jgi:hypothetical protein